MFIQTLTSDLMVHQANHHFIFIFVFSPVAFMNKQIKRKIVSIDANYTHSKLLCNLIDQQDWDFDFLRKQSPSKELECSWLELT